MAQGLDAMGFGPKGMRATFPFVDTSRLRASVSVGYGMVGRSALSTCIPQRVKWETLSLEQGEDRKPTHEQLGWGDGRPFTEMR